MKDNIKNILKASWPVAAFEKLSGVVRRFSFAEKLVFYVLAAILIVSGLVMLQAVNRSVSTDVPAAGGTFVEGIVGTPRFINPVLAVSDADQDLTELIYSGLMKATPSGALVPDLAESYTVATSGLVYTFTLRNDAYFSDGVKITADDVVYTINEIQDPAVKSPERPSFYDVTVTKIDDRTVAFTLKQPYAAFLDNLTVGILPKHVWDNMSADEFPLSEYNVEPIGSGPYEIGAMHTTNKNMIVMPTEYDLVPNDRYALGAPYIKDFVVKFYPDEASLLAGYQSGSVHAAASIDPADAATAAKAGTVLTSPLPRVFAVFFNQNQSSVLAFKEVRQALSDSVDRSAIVSDVLSGYGSPISGPIPAGFLPAESSSSAVSYNLSEASSTLAKAGWSRNASGIWEKKAGKNMIDLSFTIATLASPDLVKAANIIADEWRALGADVTVNEYDLGDLQQNVIRPRKFDALLYGLVTGRDMDFYAFWDSSQRNDPGLNISMYASSAVDKLLEDARGTLDSARQMKDYAAFAADVEADVPAVFLYSPEFIYAVPNNVKGIDLGAITLPFERYLGVNTWYIDTNNVWNAFLQKK
ncbi:MAG: peptide ABC transporter substrate-binding protein [Patescibacteria group bacterium]|nr:peptide ABC transporter substrate-binding protein [Patescibacteria group bacterium]